MSSWMKRSLSKRTNLLSSPGDGSPKSPDSPNTRKYWTHVKKSLTALIKKAVDSNEDDVGEAHPLGGSLSSKVEWQSLERVQKHIASHPNEIVFVGFGVSWNIPTLCTMRHIQEFSRSKKMTGISTFVVDCEEHRDFCEVNDILVGSSCLIVWFGASENIIFNRKGLQPSEVFIGQLSSSKLEQLIHLVVQRMTMGGNDRPSGANEPPATVVDIPF